ncbi:hypothetical protein CEXT_360081 [Caerostris extrusa]|uniref:Uncharacterized protein n=1 Tax=Caerostris extrusa TaxID=172846 RepID=A0AAV4MLK3_CAEEX|nr:hypothetical protein CEXT_360081 [Caerostris extrusa]
MILRLIVPRAAETFKFPNLSPPLTNRLDRLHQQHLRLTLRSSYRSAKIGSHSPLQDYGRDNSICNSGNLHFLDCPQGCGSITTTPTTLIFEQEIRPDIEPEICGTERATLHNKKKTSSEKEQLFQTIRI